MRQTLLAFSVLLFATHLAADAIRIPLKAGVLFVPNGRVHSDNTINLIIHLHGAHEVVERNITRSRPDDLWLNLTLPGLSSVYRKHFENPDVFPATLTAIHEALEKHYQVEHIRVRHLTLMSFSAGFGGVRELLKQPAAVEKIDALIMADSLYAGFIGNVALRKLNPDHLKPFVDFANLAAKGNKQMVLSHTELFTPEYASTKETADYLIHSLKGTRVRERRIRSDSLTELSHFKTGNFAVMGFEGTTGEDHMNHLRFIQLFLDEIHF